MKGFTVIVFVAMAISALAQQGKKRPYRLTRTLVADLNNDKRPDTIRLFSTLDDWNSFNKISISLTGYGKTVFKARDYWTELDSEFLVANKNAIHTKLLFFKKTNIHSVILLFGEIDGAGYRGEFSIINIENNRMKMVFDPFNDENGEPDIEWPATLTDLNHDGRLDFVYKDMGELYEPVKGGEVGTYVPYFVYPVFDICKVDTPLTKSYNEQYYVYAGLDFKKRIEIFYPSDHGKPRIWKRKALK